MEEAISNKFNSDNTDISQSPTSMGSQEGSSEIDPENNTDIEARSNKVSKNGGERLTKNGLNLKLNIKAAARAGKRPGLLGEVKSALVPSLKREDDVNDNGLVPPLTGMPNESSSNEKSSKSEKARNLFILKSFLISKSRKPTDDQPSEKQAQDSDNTNNESSGGGRIHRSSIICSTGADKYTYDSESVFLPLRPIDLYEKQLSILSTASSTGSSSRSRMYNSATEDHSDREASLSPVCERLKFDPMETSSPLDQLYLPNFHSNSHHHHRKHHHHHQQQQNQHYLDNLHNQSLQQFYVHRQSPSPSPSPSFHSSSPNELTSDGVIRYNRSSIIGNAQSNSTNTKPVQMDIPKSQARSRFKLSNILKFGSSNKDKRNDKEVIQTLFKPMQS